MTESNDGAEDERSDKWLHIFLLGASGILTVLALIAFWKTREPIVLAVLVPTALLAYLAWGFWTDECIERAEREADRSKGDE